MWNTDNDADYYRRQAEEAEERIRSIRREQQEERNRRLEDMRAAGEAWQRTADDWQDAFAKQRNLYWREMRTDDEVDLVRYFQRGIEVVDRGEQLYSAEMEAIAPQIETLLAQIEALKNDALERVASQIEQEFSEDEDAIAHSDALANALRANEPSEWLNW